MRAASHGHEIRSVQGFLDEALSGASTDPSPVALAVPQGRVGRIPEEARVLGLGPEVEVRLRLETGDWSRYFNGKGERISLAMQPFLVPSRRQMTLRVVRPPLAFGTETNFELAGQSEQEQYERTLQVILLRTSSSHRDRAQVAFALEDQRDSEAYSHACSTLLNGPDSKEAWALLACAAHRVGDHALRDRALKSFKAD